LPVRCKWNSSTKARWIKTVSLTKNKLGEEKKMGNPRQGRSRLRTKSKTKHGDKSIFYVLNPNQIRLNLD